MKYAFLALGFVLVASTWAQDLPNQESTFAIKEQGTYSGIYTLKVKNKKVFVNGIELPNTQVEKNLKEIASLLENSGKEENCSGNEFVHQVKDSQNFKRERGCLNQKRFSELQQNFQKLTKLVQ